MSQAVHSIPSFQDNDHEAKPDCALHTIEAGSFLSRRSMVMLTLP